MNGRLPCACSPAREGRGIFAVTHGCLTHLTPEIIAFRLVTGRISIQSGSDLFSEEVCGRDVALRMDATCFRVKIRLQRYVLEHGLGKESLKETDLH